MKSILTRYFFAFVFCIGSLQAASNAKENYERAVAAEFQRLIAAAQNGDAEAQYNLVDVYARGIGTTKNNDEAAKWLRKAADQNYAPAQFTLANWLLDGVKVPKDQKEAVRLYTMVAERGGRTASLQLGKCYAQGLGIKADPLLACAWANVAKYSFRNHDSEFKQAEVIFQGASKSLTQKEIDKANDLGVRMYDEIQNKVRAESQKKTKN